MSRGKLRYIIGDATSPIGTGNKIIIHSCNDEGKWGRGFVSSISKKWSEPESVFRQSKTQMLGYIQIIHVNYDTYVINMISQRGCHPDSDNRPPIS
jgi:hypothetical protein